MGRVGLGSQALISKVSGGLSPAQVGSLHRCRRPPPCTSPHRKHQGADPTNPRLQGPAGSAISVGQRHRGQACFPPLLLSCADRAQGHTTMNSRARCLPRAVSRCPRPRDRLRAMALRSFRTHLSCYPRRSSSHLGARAAPGCGTVRKTTPHRAVPEAPGARLRLRTPSGPGYGLGCPLSSRCPPSTLSWPPGNHLGCPAVCVPPPGAQPRA